MPRFVGFTPTDEVTVKAVYQKCRLILEDVALNFGSAKSRSAFEAVMGVASGTSTSGQKSAETDLEKTLMAMRMRIATVSFKVQYNAALAANAEMLSFSNIPVDDVASTVDQWRSGSAGNEEMPLSIGTNFFAEPYYDVIDQCQLGTFLHELSHHAAATQDDTVGGDCYQWSGVCRLRTLGPARAVRNAENVAYYCLFAAMHV